MKYTPFPKYPLTRYHNCTIIDMLGKGLKDETHSQGKRGNLDTEG